MAEHTKIDILASAKEVIPNQDTFFPYRQEVAEKEFTVPLLKRFPFVGGICMLGSLITFGLSALVLKLTNDKSVEDYIRIKPSAWLAIILSLNALFLRQAIAEGVNVSWWYRASKPDATVADLHRTWALGTSTLKAASAGRRFNYIALATLFCATIPLNGLLLQNSINTVVQYRNTDQTIMLNMFTKFPQGYSAKLNNDKSFSVLTPDFRYIATKVAMAYSGDGSLPIVSNFYDTQNKCAGYCNMTARGVGFQSSCNKYTVPYNLPEDSSTNTTATQLTIFDIGYVWTPSNPNVIKVNTVSKYDQTCSGNLVVENCTLTMAEVDYALAINYVKDASNEAIYAMYLTPYTEMPTSDFLQSPNPKLLSPNEGGSNTTFGGIAEVLGAYFNSSMVFKQSKGHSAIDPEGALANSWTFTTDKTNANGTAKVDIDNLCEIAVGPSPLGQDMTTYALETARATLMFTSMFGAQSNNESVQTVLSNQSESLSVYSIEWRWLWASLAVTIMINLFILPTYWGYWDLKRKTTMSPMETARAFQAPIVGEAGISIETKHLVKQIGSKRVNVKSRDGEISVDDHEDGGRAASEKKEEV